jgi:transporter family protein
MPRWFLYSLLTMLLWGGWGVVSKPVSTSMSPWQVQCLSTVGLLPVLILLAVMQLRSWREFSRALLPAFAGGVISSVGNIACYQALATGGKAAAVIPLTSLYPVVTIILARRLLRERLNVIQWGGIVASFAALGSFIAAGSDGLSSLLSPWLIAALVPIVLWGVSDFLQKLTTGRAPSEAVTFAFLLGLVPAAVLIPAFEVFVWPVPAMTWLLLILLGLLYGLGNFMLISAYGSGGRASVVTPITSLYSLVTIPLAVLILHERISGLEGVGIALALLAVVALGHEVPPPAADIPDNAGTY